MPYLSRSSFNKSSTCAWTVTSRAVVGSSAMIICGLLHTDMAMITLWHIPPDSSYGYASIRRLASGIPTRFSASSAMFLASALVTFWWAHIISTIWLPTLKTGDRDVIGFWKIMDMSFPLNSSSSFWLSLRTSVPLKSMDPPTIFPVLAGRRWMMELDVTLLPEPDSPTMPRISPFSTSKLTPSTALLTPPEV